MEATKTKIREMLATRLKLGAAMEKIADDTVLFGPEGFGLDSIDALELVLGLQKEFGVVIEDRQLAVKVLTSIESIAAHVAARAKT